MSNFDQADALVTGFALTRSGKLVYNLRAATLKTGETILIGQVSRRPRKGEFLLGVSGWWHGGGLGSGSDDLVDYKGRPSAMLDKIISKRLADMAKADLEQ